MAFSSIPSINTSSYSQILLLQMLMHQIFLQVYIVRLIVEVGEQFEKGADNGFEYGCCSFRFASLLINSLFVFLSSSSNSKAISLIFAILTSDKSCLWKQIEG